MDPLLTTVAEKRKFLHDASFIIGDRDPRLNQRFVGRYMVAESYEDDETPTDDGRDGPWCIVGDDLDALINQAYAVWEHDLTEQLERALKLARED